MQVAKIENGQVGEIIDFRTHFGMTNSVTDDQLAAQGFAKVSVFRAHDALTEKLVPCAPVLENGWVYTVAVAPLTDEEIQSAKDSAMVQLRANRNNLLASCDWTQIPDCTVDKQVWATYRQALRDFPATVSDARLPVIWPRNPNWDSNGALA